MEPVETNGATASESLWSEVWNWLRLAPLPVVLAISLVGFGTIGNWVSRVSAETDRAKTAAEEAKSKADQAKSASDKSDSKLDKIDDKINKLLEEVIRLRTIQEQADAKKKGK